MRLLTLLIFILTFLMPIATGLIAQESWLWFYISIPFALLAGFFFICLPGIPRKKAGKIWPVEDAEIFDHLFINKTKKTNITLRNNKLRKVNQQ